jgi:hypothetical protein
MKMLIRRALVIAAVVTLSLPAFAQLSIKGYYRAGGTDNVDEDSNQTATLSDRIRLNLSFAAPDDMYGFSARLQADSSGSTSGLINLFTNSAKTTVKTTTTGTADTTTGALTATSTSTATTTVSPLASLKYGYAYAKFFDGMVKFSAGKLDINDYSVKENTGNLYLGNVYSDETKVKGALLGGQQGTTTGAIVQTWPIENLSVAVHMMEDGTGPALHHFGADAYYMVPGVGKALFSSQLGSSSIKSNEFDTSFASAGFNYTGFSGLSATASLRYNGNMSVSETGDETKSTGAIAIIEYNVAPIFGNISADVDLTNAHYYLEGEASYQLIPQIKVRAYGAYTDNLVYMAKINTLGSSVANKGLVGADLVFPIGNGKGDFTAGVAYGDKSKIQIPFLATVNF